MLRAYRRRAGLSQRELGVILGYPNGGEVSRHERVKTIPPFVTALAYEAVFRVPASVLFPDLHADIRQRIEGTLAAFERQLEMKNGRGRGATVTAQKLTWLTERRSAE